LNNLNVTHLRDVCSHAESFRKLAKKYHDSEVWPLLEQYIGFHYISKCFWHKNDFENKCQVIFVWLS